MTWGLFLAFVWLLLSAAVGETAKGRGRSFAPWFIAAVFLTPVIASIALLSTPRLAYSTRISGVTIEADPADAPRLADVPRAIMISIAAAAVAFTVAYVAPAVQPDVAAKDDECGNTTRAYIMSQEFVKKHLKSPATADFPSLYADGVTANMIGRCRFGVTAFVDSQNAFGAMIRTSYSAKLRYDKNTGSWTMEESSLK